MKDGPNTPVKATETSVHLLDQLLDVDGATVTELDQQLSLSKSSIHNHLKTLEHLGLVVRDGWTYRVSFRFLEVGNRVRERHPLVETGLPHVQGLTMSSGCTAGLAVFERDVGVCLYTSSGKKVDEPVVLGGEALPLHCTAPGKAMLALQSPEDVEDIVDEQGLPEHTEHTPTSRPALTDELRTIRSRDVAFEREEWKNGIRGVAAAVEHTGKDLVGAIAVWGPTSALSGKRFQQDIPGLVISASNDINKAFRAE